MLVEKRNLELALESARQPAPKSRTEAQVGFEAAVLDRLPKFGIMADAKERPHLKKFRKWVGQGRWWLYAQEERPNRGTVSVVTVDGDREEIAIGRRHGVEKDRVLMYRVNRQRYPELAARQDEILSGEVVTNSPWTYVVTGEVVPVRNKKRRHLVR